MDRRANWELLLEAAQQLAGQGITGFSRRELLDAVRKKHPDRPETSLGPTLQGMTVNAQGGPTSAGGKAFLRVDHGLYELHDSSLHSNLNLGVPARKRTITRRQERAQIIDKRVSDVVEQFPEYIHIYDQRVPFIRSGQWSSHDATIRLRRELGGISAAVRDDEFLISLYNTLRKWGIGKRASRLVPFDSFVTTLRQDVAGIEALETLNIEDAALDIENAVEGLWNLIRRTRIVENKAKVVAGTKTLHHLLPDLIPPMDRDWTGDFFIWSLNDFQNRQRQIFEEGFRAFAQIAQAVRPSQYVGTGWRTCPAKILDNAVIGYMLHQVSDTTSEEMLPDVTAMTIEELLDLQKQIQSEIELRTLEHTDS